MSLKGSEQYHFKIKIETLSPIIIGSGEEYEPYNFAIDRQEKRLYFFGDLYPLLQKGLIFPYIFSTSGPSAPWRIHFELQRQLPRIKEEALYSVEVTDGIISEHIRFERRFQENQLKAKFEIKRHIRKQAKKKGKYTWWPYIPGSSLKGAIMTALQAQYFRKFGAEEWWKMFGETKRGLSPTERLGKCLKISDSRPIKEVPTAEVGFGVSVPRFRYEPNGNSMPVYLEVVKKGYWQSTLRIAPAGECLGDQGREIKGAQLLEISNLVKSVNDHYVPLLKQQLNGGNVLVKFFEKVPPDRPKEKYLREFLPWALNPNNRKFIERKMVDYTPEYLAKEFVDRAKKELKRVETDNKLKKGSFKMLLRVGQHSQSRAVTIPEIRAIEIRRKRERNYWSDNETTFWGYHGRKERENLFPFGWVICTITPI
ncbi:MAG: RAMP superfamily CRISPR-associated protein [Campylobacterales bacterium]